MRIQISLSAVPLSAVRPYMKHFDRSLYRGMFQKYGTGKNVDKYRIYIPITGDLGVRKESVVPQQIISALEDKGYSVSDYRAGIAVDRTGKRQVRIGKLLTDPGTKKIYDNDPQRISVKNVNTWVVISRHPYDILGMSFDRGWTSCMHLTEGCNKHYLEADVKYGTIVAYMVKENDKNINSPIARIAMKPFNMGNHTILVSGPMYGQGTPKFAMLVSKFCTEHNESAPTGEYEISPSLYDDDSPVIVFHVQPGTDVLSLSKRQATNAAQDRNTHSDVLDALIARGEYNVLLQIAGNISAPVGTLSKVLHSPLNDSESDKLGDLYKISLQVMRNPACSTGLLAEIGTDEFLSKFNGPCALRIVDGLLDNDGTPAPVVEHLFRMPSVRNSVYVMEALAGRTDLTESMMLELVDSTSDDGNNIHSILAYNKSITPAVIEKLITGDAKVRGNLASNPAAYLYLDKLAEDEDIRVLRFLGTNPKVTDDIMMRILQHKYYADLAVYALADLPRYGPKVIRRLLDIFTASTNLRGVDAILRHCANHNIGEVLNYVIESKMWDSSVIRPVTNSRMNIHLAEEQKLFASGLFLALLSLDSLSSDALNLLFAHCVSVAKALKLSGASTSECLINNRVILLRFATHQNTDDKILSVLRKSRFGVVKNAVISRLNK